MHFLMLSIFIHHVASAPLLHELYLQKQQKVTNGHLDFVVVVPSVKRKTNYLTETLQALERQKTDRTEIFLINANDPPGDHTDLLKWCGHDSFTCLGPPNVSVKILDDAVRLDERNNTPDFLRWRTRENAHAIFALSKALERHSDHIIFLQDDVIVQKKLSLKIRPLSYKPVVKCLRDGRAYCGATALLMTRPFVKQLLKKIKSKMITDPIDWLVFGEQKYIGPREPIAHHIGVQSSKPDIIEIQK